MSRILILLCAALLVGCGSGYHVQKVGTGRYEPNDKGGIREEMEYLCRHIRPLFWNDIVIAQCKTAEECNAICAKMREKP